MTKLLGLIHTQLSLRCFAHGYGLENQTGAWAMSQHPSLKSASKIRAKRNVLKRFERIDILTARGKWKEGNRGTGLPKTKAGE